MLPGQVEQRIYASSQLYIGKWWREKFARNDIGHGQRLRVKRCTVIFESILKQFDKKLKQVNVGVLNHSGDGCQHRGHLGHGPLQVLPSRCPCARWKEGGIRR